MPKLHLYYKKNILQWMQFSGLNVVINDNAHLKLKNWKEEVVQVPVGKLKIRMSMPYLGSDVGNAEVMLEANEGEEIFAKYIPPLIMFSPGTIIVQKTIQQ